MQITRFSAENYKSIRYSSYQWVQYRKPDHAVLIAKWLLDHRSEELGEVADCLRQAFTVTQTAVIVEEETGSHPH